VLLSMYFFFQAEDGIRDDLVTGVQTCALPISALRAQAINREVHPDFADAPERRKHELAGPAHRSRPSPVGDMLARSGECSPVGRSEERRVGKEGRGQWGVEYTRVRSRQTRGLR